MRPVFAMIDVLMTMLRNRLENVLQQVQPRPEDWIVLGNAGARDAGAAAPNRFVMALIGLRTDPTSGAFASPRQGADDRLYAGFPPLRLDAYVLISAQFEDANYAAALARLSTIIAYLQGLPVLTPQNMPDLPPELSKVAVDFTDLDFGDLSHIMTATGGRMGPLVAYRLRHLPFGADTVSGAAPRVSAADTPRGAIA
jgi:hypothetical protein